MAATRELAIPIPHEEIAAFCRKWGGRKVDLVKFNSVNRWIRADVLSEAVDEYVEAR